MTCEQGGPPNVNALDDHGLPQFAKYGSLAKRLREGLRVMLQQTSYAADAGRIAGLQRDIRSGALSAKTLVERCLARIDAIDPAVQAWRHVAHDSARTEADLMDREAKAGCFRGALHGIPVGIKDIIDVAGLPTTCHSKILIDHIAAEDAVPAHRRRIRSGYSRRRGCRGRTDYAR